MWCVGWFAEAVLCPTRQSLELEHVYEPVRNSRFESYTHITLLVHSGGQLWINFYQFKDEFCGKKSGLRNGKPVISNFYISLVI